MVDLDSNPTKLIEIVEIGKQMLMTRGALTTFSIANDVAKYFAIIPAAFVGTYPQLEGARTSCAWPPRQRRSCRRVIFNALIIVVLIPLALRACAIAPIGAAALLRRNLLVYGVGGIIAAVHRHQADRPAAGGVQPRLNRRIKETHHVIHPSSRAGLSSALDRCSCGVALPAAVTGVGQRRLSRPGQRQPLERDGKPVGSALIGQPFTAPGTSGAGRRPPRRRPTTRRLRAARTWGRPIRRCWTRVKARIAALQRPTRNRAPVPVDLVTARPAASIPTSAWRRRTTRSRRVAARARPARGAGARPGRGRAHRTPASVSSASRASTCWR